MDSCITDEMSKYKINQIWLCDTIACTRTAIQTCLGIKNGELFENISIIEANGSLKILSFDVLTEQDFFLIFFGIPIFFETV